MRLEKTHGELSAASVLQMSSERQQVVSSVCSLCLQTE